MLETLIFALGLNAILFLFAFTFKTDKLTDITYALSFAGIAVYGIYSAEFLDDVKWLAFGLVIAWSVRLGGYLLYRISKIGKDNRFDDKRNSFIKFGSFWLFQALTAWVVMIPYTFLMNNVVFAELNTFTQIGAAIAAFGLLFEAIADMQKFKFIQNPSNKGKWIESGVWKYSRHPNYFGEITMWFGMYLLCVGWLTDQQALIGAASPLLITLLLGFISGIPILEKSGLKKWGSNKDYQKYLQETSILIPMPRGK